MKHESKTWYSCDRCGCELGNPKSGTLFRIMKKDGATITETEKELTSEILAETETFADIKVYWWDKTEAKQLCRSCFKKYQKLLADFLKSEK